MSGIGAGRPPRKRKLRRVAERLPAQSSRTCYLGVAASAVLVPAETPPVPPHSPPPALFIYSSCLHWPISGSVVSQARPAVPSTPRCAQSRRHRSGANGAGRQQVSRGPEGARPRVGLRGSAAAGSPCGMIHLRAVHYDALPPK